MYSVSLYSCMILFLRPSIVYQIFKNSIQKLIMLRYIKASLSFHFFWFCLNLHDAGNRKELCLLCTFGNLTPRVIGHFHVPGFQIFGVETSGWRLIQKGNSFTLEKEKCFPSDYYRFPCFIGMKLFIEMEGSKANSWLVFKRF